MNKKLGIILISGAVTLTILISVILYRQGKNQEMIKSATGVENQTEIFQEQKKLENIKEEITQVYDQEAPDFIQPNVDKQVLEKAEQQLATIKQALAKLTNNKQTTDVKDVKKSYEDTASLFFNAKFRYDTQEQINQLFTPLAAVKGKEQPELTKAPLQSLAVVTSDKGQKTTVLNAMNGKYAYNKLAIADQATSKQVTTLRSTIKKPPYSEYKSTGEWEKNVEELLKEAETQVTHVEKTKAGIDSLFNKETVKESIKLNDYNQWLAEVAKIKNETIKAKLTDRLMKVKAHLDQQPQTKETSTSTSEEKNNITATDNESDNNNYNPQTPGGAGNRPPATGNGTGNGNNQGNQGEETTTPPVSPEPKPEPEPEPKPEPEPEPKPEPEPEPKPEPEPETSQ